MASRVIVPSGGATINPATTVVSGTSFGQAPAVGVDTTYAREDHGHGTPAAPSIPAAATTVVAGTAYGQAPAVGVDTTYAREDHGHGTPTAVAIRQTILGYNTIGGSFESQAASSFSTIGKAVTPASSGILATIDVYMKGNGANIPLLVPAVWADNAGAPGLLEFIGGAAADNSGSNRAFSASISATGRWVSLPCGLWVAAGVQIWIGVDIGNGSSIAYDAPGTDKSSTGNGVSWIQEAIGGSPARKYSIRATHVTVS